MAYQSLERVKFLTFDIFGTVMDLTGSLSGPAGEFLAANGSDMTRGGVLCGLAGTPAH